MGLMLLLVQRVALKYVKILTCCQGKHENFVDVIFNMDISTMMQNGT